VSQDRQLVLEALATLYVQGYTLDWTALYSGEPHCVQLPTYPWQRERLWLEWLDNLGAVKESGGEPAIQKANGHAPNGHTQPSLLTDTAGPANSGRVGCARQPAASSVFGKSEFLQRLQETPPGQQQDLLLAHVREQVVGILGLDSAYPLKPHQGLFEAGLNSLGAVELINHLQTSLGHTLPATLVFEYPTLGALSEYLAKKVLSLESTPPSQAELQPDQDVIRIAQLEQLSEAEAEALLIEKLRGI
jgi:acyl transferase domain-containing protein